MSDPIDATIAPEEVARIQSEWLPEGSTAVAVAEEPKPEDEISYGYELAAIDGGQLVSAHARMIEWVDDQIKKTDAEKREETQNLKIATERKWATAPFKKHVARLTRQREFYEKIRLALNLGYVVVPNFEMSIFAIRTKVWRPRPNTQDNDNGWARQATAFEQRSQTLPAGEGRYENPIPVVAASNVTKIDNQGKKFTAITQWATDFKEIQFPVALAKPILMTKTAEALAAKVFDEVGVAVDTQRAWRGNRRGDPIILGRIRNPRQRADITFFIGWYFDPTNL